MTLIAALTFVILAVIAALHFVWAMGSTFPVADPAELSRMVTGFKRRDLMPGKPATLLVSFAVLLAGFWALVLADWAWLPAPNWFVALGGIVLTVVFLARGIAGYTDLWRQLTPEQPFARLDRKYYSPLCLVLGLFFIILTLGYVT